jgi:hypothetical protein
MSHAAFLGTGLLGSAFVEAAARRGDQLTVWNRTADKAQALAPLGVTVAATPADAARGAARVHLVLKDDAVVEEVVAALRPGLAPDAVIVDHTTTQPARTAERARRLNAEGVRYLHCPVFIGPAAARQGRAPSSRRGRAPCTTRGPHLARMAPRVEYLGERPDLAGRPQAARQRLHHRPVGPRRRRAERRPRRRRGPRRRARVLEFFDPASVIRGRGQNMAAATSRRPSSWRWRARTCG